VVGMVSILFALIMLVGCSPIELPPGATFYSIGYEYQSDNILSLEGKICTVRVDANKGGMAGIEQDINIVTLDGKLTVEITNWYYNGDTKLGYIVYKDGAFLEAQRQPCEIGEIYTYRVSIFRGKVYINIADSKRQSVLRHKVEGCNARYISSTASYIEYWRYNEVGSFYYYGYVTIENEYLSHKDDFYHKSQAYPFGMYFIHHNWSGITDKGEIDDRNV